MLQSNDMKLFVLFNLAGVSTSRDRANFVQAQWSMIAETPQKAHRNLGFLNAWSRKPFVNLSGNYNDCNIDVKAIIRKTGTARVDLTYHVVLKIVNSPSGFNYPVGYMACSSRYASENETEITNNFSSIESLSSSQPSFRRRSPSERSSRPSRISITQIARNFRNRIDVSNIVFPEDFKYLKDNINPDYTFGVEIEFQSFIDGREVCKKFWKNELTVEDRHTEYGKASADYWVLCYDSSVGVHTGSLNGYELTTPALKGFDGLKELHRYCQILKELEREHKIQIKIKCGLHTHHGNFSPLTEKSIAKNFRENYSLNERWLDSIMPKSRRESKNYYCFAIDNAHNHSGYSSLTDIEDFKYQKVSLKKFNEIGTLEIRHHSGTISFVKMANWIVFNQKIIKKIFDGYIPVCKNSLLEYVMAFAEDCNELVEYFLTRKALLNPVPAHAIESE